MKKTKTKASKKVLKKQTTAKKKSIKKMAAKAKGETVKKSSTKKKATATQKKIKLGIFGGTFDPIHYGHLNSLEVIQEVLKLDKVWIVPTNKNPLRTQTAGPGPEHRLNMVKAILPLLNKTEKPIFEVFDGEIRRGGVSYTYDTLVQIQKSMKSAELYLIMGADQLENFHRWKNFKKILSLAHLVVTSRPGAVIPEIKSDMPKEFQAVVRSFKNQKGTLVSGKKIIFSQLNDVDVSSTQIRKKLRNKENVSALTPSLVYNYIEQNNLYADAAKVGDYRALTQYCVERLDEKAGKSILAYDLTNIDQSAEYTIATSGTSTRHSRALADHIIKTVKDEYGLYPQATEGLQEGRWIVIDYGALIVHVFYEYVRNEYRIEDLWRQGRIMSMIPSTN